MIRKFTLGAAAIALLACGGQETPPSAEADVASQPSPAKAVTRTDAPRAGAPSGTAATGTPAAGAAATSTIVAGCLDLVSRQQWTQAVPACTRALGVDPNNNQVQQALETAKTQAAQATAAAAAKMAEGQAAASQSAASAAAAKKSAEDAAAAAGELGGALGDNP
jgi:hypothetical protein